MTWWQAILLALAVYGLLVLALLLAGRGSEARALARFIPDCLVLFRRLLGDPRVPRRRRLVIALALGYLALPFDLVPDVIPVAGALDDALVVVIALRALLRGTGAGLVREHWPGPAVSLQALLRLV